MSEYTSEQAKLVEEILRIRQTDYYKALKVDKSATDIEIKKSYRKLAIKLHPDKNKHPKASDAFKVIAKAFEILGDESKRRMYDMTGADPDSRGGMGGGGGAGPGGPGAGFSNFQGFQGFQGFPQGAGMSGNINEDLLNMLFGGGLGGNGFAFQFGGNGFSPNGFNRFGNPGMNARRRAHQQQQRRAGRSDTGPEVSLPSWASTAFQFLPLIIIAVSMFINYILGGGSSADGNKQFHGKVPLFQYQESPYYNVERLTPKYNVPYYIDERTMNDFSGRQNSEKEFKGLDQYVESQYVQQLQTGCVREKNYQKEVIENAHGIFYNDWDTIEKARKMPLPHCEKLSELNIL